MEPGIDMDSAMGKYVIVIGLVVVCIGVILYFFPNAFKWFGNLPGDIKSEGENTQFYFPIVSMLVITVAYHLVKYLINLLR